MGRKLFCDRCHFEIAETDELKAEFTDIKLAKLSTPMVHFEHMEVCHNCTGSLRLWFQLVVEAAPVPVPESYEPNDIDSEDRIPF